MNIKEEIKKNLESQIESIEKLEKNHVSKIEEIFHVLVKAREDGKKIFLLGNGGSASTATHFASDLLKTSILVKEKRFKAISLTDNIPVMLAWANDTAYNHIFKNQLENFIEKNDVVIGISGSGNSKNVYNAIQYANKMKANTIVFTGRDGGKISKISKTSLKIPSNDMLTIETIHLLICHLLVSIVRKQGKPMFKY
ncbi:MAG: phosphoheptose isomerase [Euryarchaeota archaeon]|nr:phosphoheptose isomerase [Euryarchaeota archaeon]